jgi:hypothetical protein
MVSYKHMHDRDKIDASLSIPTEPIISSEVDFGQSREL